MTDTPIKDEQINIEAALHELADLAVRARAGADLDQRPLSFADLGEEVISLAAAGELATQAAAIVRSPTREAAKAAIRVLGERLFEIGGLRALEDALDRAADRDAEWGEHRAALINLAWDGIGAQGPLSGWVA